MYLYPLLRKDAESMRRYGTWKCLRAHSWSWFCSDTLPMLRVPLSCGQRMFKFYPPSTTVDCRYRYGAGIFSRILCTVPPQPRKVLNWGRVLSLLSATLCPAHSHGHPPSPMESRCCQWRYGPPPETKHLRKPDSSCIYTRCIYIDI